MFYYDIMLYYIMLLVVLYGVAFLVVSCRFPCVMSVSSFYHMLCENVSDHQGPSSSCDCCPVCSDLPPMTSTSNSWSREHKLVSGSLRCWEYFRKSDITWTLGWKRKSMLSLSGWSKPRRLIDSPAASFSALAFRKSWNDGEGRQGSSGNSTCLAANPHHTETSPRNLEKVSAQWI